LIWQLAAGMARLLPPEAAHRAAVATLRHRIGPRPDLPSIPVTVAGLDFASPLGLAAGFDKDASCPDGALQLGFSHVELGTITPRPQPGNPRPRVFRLAADRAVVNRYGFNSRGMEAAAAQLAERRAGSSTQPGVIGINVGANKTSTRPTEDYRLAVARLASYADYITLNVSSPNTPGLRDLQTADNLRLLIAAGRAGLVDAGCQRPLFIKLAPDLAAADIEAIAATAVEENVAGLIATNTTIARPDGLRSAQAGETGGLSGAPLFAMATHVLADMAKRLSADGPVLIGAGGVASGWQAYAKILVGASLVQLYTALALEGPDLPAKVIRQLAKLMSADGVSDLATVRGQIRDADKAMQHALRLAQSV